MFTTRFRSLWCSTVLMKDSRHAPPNSAGGFRVRRAPPSSPECLKLWERTWLFFLNKNILTSPGNYIYKLSTRFLKVEKIPGGETASRSLEGVGISLPIHEPLPLRRGPFPKRQCLEWQRLWNRSPDSKSWCKYTPHRPPSSLFTACSISVLALRVLQRELRCNGHMHLSICIGVTYVQAEILMQ